VFAAGTRANGARTPFSARVQALNIPLDAIPYDLTDGKPLPLLR
jgi:hypothetical protein